MPSLTTLTVPNRNGVAKDAVKWSVAFDDAPALGSMQAWWTDLLDHNYGTAAVVGYIGQCLDFTAATLAIYDLTGHLDGSPHGSPVDSASGFLSGPDSPQNTDGNQLAIVVGFQDSAYDATPTVTGSGEVPTPEQAQDYGAPATHTGELKGKARHSGRLYIGPVAINAVATDGNHNPVLGAPCLADFSAAFGAHMPSGADSHGLHWSIWSRRDAVLRHVAQGWVDHCIKTRRSREFVNDSRTTF